MWLAIYGFLKPLLTLKNIAIVSVIIALIIGVLAYGNKRAADGFKSGSASQLQDDKTQFEGVLSQYKTALDTKQKQIDAEDQLLQGLKTQVQTLSSQYVALAALRTQGQQQVSQLEDAQVQADLEAKLGGALTNPVILRKADDIVTDYPLVLKQLEVNNDKVDTLSKEVEGLSTKVELVSGQRNAAISFGNTVVGYYTKAYNAAQVHHSKFVKIITFGLVRDKHLNLPEPVTLKP